MKRFEELLNNLPQERRDKIEKRSQELLEGLQPTYGPETQKAIEELGVYGYVPITNELVDKVNRILNIVEKDEK